MVKAVGQIAVGDPEALTLYELLAVLATEIFMLPSPVTGGDLFPLNGPAWSLFFELLINALFAAFFVSMRSALLRIISLIAAVGVFTSAFQAETLNVGWNWATAWGGLARVTCLFCVGVLVSRQRITPATGSWLALLPMLILLAVMILPMARSLRPLYDTTVALVIAPVLLVYGAKWQAPAVARGACEVLGDLSYPLYAIHFPLLFIAGFAARSLGISSVLWVPPFILGLAAFAWVLGRYVDPAIRRTMTSALAIRRAPA